MYVYVYTYIYIYSIHHIACNFPHKHLQCQPMSAIAKPLTELASTLRRRGLRRQLREAEMNHAYEPWKCTGLYPTCSMYGISTYIWVIYGIHVGKYSMHGVYGCVKTFCTFLH